MISDSTPYKYELCREVRKIRQLFRNSGQIRSNKRFFELEKFLFVTSFLIRKLVESNKMSDELEASRFELEYVKAVDIHRARDYISRHHIEQNYDLRNRSLAHLKLGDISNIFIHSHVFELLYSPLRTTNQTEKIEIMVTSDYKLNRLFFLKLSAYLEICDSVFEDQIVYQIVKSGPDGHRSIAVKSREHPSI